MLVLLMANQTTMKNSMRQWQQSKGNIGFANGLPTTVKEKHPNGY